MVTLLEKLKDGHTASRRLRNNVLTNLLGTIIAECDTIAKSGKAVRVLTDVDVVTVIQKSRKNMLSTIEMIANISERTAQKTQLLQEREYLEEYLPQQLTKEEIEQISIEQEILNQNFGQIMGYLKKNYAGRYDPNHAKDIIREVVCVEKSA